MTQADFERHVTDGRQKLYRIARSYLSNEQDCYDAISEAIFKAWLKLPDLREEKYFSSWLIRILIRECLTIYRRNKRRYVPIDPQRAVTQSHESDLTLAIDALPQKLRVVVVMHYMEGMRIEDVALALHTRPGTVSARLSTARKNLKTLLKEDV